MYKGRVHLIRRGGVSDVQTFNETLWISFGPFQGLFRAFYNLTALEKLTWFQKYGEEWGGSVQTFWIYISVCLHTTLHLSCHLWFLAPNTALFSLALEKLEDKDKSRIASWLLSLPKPKNWSTSSSCQLTGWPCPVPSGIHPDYIEFKKFDCAESGVKLAIDYSKSLSKDSKERSKIYQLVEAERRAKPEAKKSTLNKWFSWFIILWLRSHPQHSTLSLYV